MTKNSNLKNFIRNKFFIDLCKSISVSHAFCGGDLYIFNKNYSFIVCDLNQDYELDFIFFDRNGMCFSQSIYSFIDFKVDIDCNEIIKSNLHIINNEVNFESLHRGLGSGLDFYFQNYIKQKARSDLGYVLKV